MSGHQIIERFGGRAAVAELTGAKPNAVTQWRTAGIPARFWHLFVSEAVARGLDGITPEALQATWPADRSRRPAPTAPASAAA